MSESRYEDTINNPEDEDGEIKPITSFAKKPNSKLNETDVAGQRDYLRRTPKAPVDLVKKNK